MIDLLMIQALQTSRERVREELGDAHTPALALEVIGGQAAPSVRDPGDAVKTKRNWKLRKLRG